MEDDEEEGGGTAPYGYVFMPRADLNFGVYADRFMDVSILLGHSADSFKGLLDTYRAMGMDRENIAEVESVVHQLKAIQMRSFMKCDGGHGVCLVKSEVTLTAEDVDALLQMHQRNGTLTDFIRRSKIM